MLELNFAYAANGRESYQIEMHTGSEGLVPYFPTPEELWDRVFTQPNEWENKFGPQPFNRAMEDLS